MTIIRSEDNANVFRKDSRDDRASESFRETKKKTHERQFERKQIHHHPHIPTNLHEYARILKNQKFTRNRKKP